MTIYRDEQASSHISYFITGGDNNGKPVPNAGRPVHTWTCSKTESIIEKAEIIFD